MPLYRQSELFAFLDSIGARPQKWLSQNFLIDGNVLEKILETAEVQKGDFVLEIGSGPGVLTEALVARGASVLAVEKDRLFAPALKRFAGVEVVEADIRDFPLDSVKTRLPPHQKAKVVANLPYHLTTPILQFLIPRFDLFSSLTFMVQDEVARRMTAHAKEDAYGSLSVFLRFYSTPTYAFKVSPRSFYPAPKVFSAIVHLTLHPPQKVASEERFFKFVRTAFQQRRKMLRASLRSLYPSPVIEKAFEKERLSSDLRPESLSLETFIRLFEHLDSN